MLIRRLFTLLATASLLSTAAVASENSTLPLDSHVPAEINVQDRLRDIESRSQGRLGVEILDTATSRGYGYRRNELFMMLSSFKPLACAAVLYRADRGELNMGQRIRYGTQDLIPWSPVTEQYAGGRGLSLDELCEATITTSDNTAANLILNSLGGPAAVTAFLRQLGDGITRLDRNEPHLNLPSDTDALDTTSPRAMVSTLQQLLLGDVLSTPSHDRLHLWLLSSTTGANRLKGGLPPDWRVGNKTGTSRTAANDVAIIWPPGRLPILVAVYLDGAPPNARLKDEAIASVGRLIYDLTFAGVD